MLGENERDRSYLLLQSPGEKIYGSAKGNIETLVKSFDGERTYQIDTPQLHLARQLDFSEQSLNMLTEDGNHIVLCGGSVQRCLKKIYYKVAGWALYRTSTENRNYSIAFDLPLDACWDIFLEGPGEMSEKIADGYASEDLLMARYRNGTVVGRPAFNVKFDGEIMKEVDPVHPFLNPEIKSESFIAWPDDWKRNSVFAKISAIVAKITTIDQLDPLNESVLSLTLNLFSKTQDFLVDLKSRDKLKD